MFLLNEFLDTNGHNTFLTIRTIIGHNNHLVRALAYFIFQDNQVF